MGVQVAEHGPNVHWVQEARWVEDGKIWTSSGVTAGIDQMYAFVAALHGEGVAEAIAERSEYVRNKNASVDPFARTHLSQ